MADNINNSGSIIPPTPDGYTNSQYTQPNQTSPFTTSDEVMYLKSMDTTLKAILQNCKNASASNVRNAAPTREEVFRDRYNQNTRRRGRRNDPLDDIFGRRKSGSKKSFMDAFEQELWDAVIGSDFKKGVNKALNGFANMMGVEIEDIPKTLGKELGRTVVGAAKQTKIGKDAFAAFDKFKQQSIERLKSAFMSGVENIDAKNHTNYAEKFRQGAAAHVSTEPTAARPKSDVSDKSVASAQSRSIDTINITATNVTITAAKIVEEGATSEEAAKDVNTAVENAKNAASNRADLVKSEPATAPPEGSDSAQNISDSMFNESISDQIPEDLSKNFRGMIDNFKGQFKQSVSNMMDSGLGKKLGGTKISQAAQNVMSKGGAAFQKLGFASKGGAAAAKSSAAAVNGSALAVKGGSALATSGTAAAGTAAGTAAAGTAATGAGAALSGLASTVGAACPYILAAVAAVVVVTKVLGKFKEALGPAVKGTKELFKEMGRAGKRDRESRKKNIEYAQQRLVDDVETLIRKPFDILEAAAQKAYDVWDSNLRLISATQGYNKADTQDLWAGYAARLRAEGLTDVVSSADMMESLVKVIDAGLSGKVAEEFAYQATLLHNAIPFEDFFNYADAYGSIYANAIKDGASHSAAIATANSELQLFASNILQASRTLTNGVNSGLQDSEKLFDYSTQIARTAQTNNAAQLSGVLTSVSAVVGAIAPNVATSIVDAVVKAAIGGNSSDIVALRSLAGINASNTEFLKEFANNPQTIFATLFDNLDKMQQGDAFMEIAEGLADTFGISIEALSQVDFQYLSKAVSAMNVSNAALKENLALLKSGETTTTAEQLKTRQINKYMLDEGLAYVLDNDAARAIQDHMWEEQIARQLMEAQYGVELKGKAINFLEGIRETIDKILDFLNPFSWLKKASNLFATAAESHALESDIRKVLELGKVGNGDVSALYALTTRNKDLNLTQSLVSQLGGFSSYEAVSAGRKLTNLFYDTLLTPGRVLNQGASTLMSAGSAMTQALSTISFSEGFGADSKYRWGTVGKSEYSSALLSSNLSNSLLSSDSVFTVSGSSAVSQPASRISEMIATLDTFAKDKTKTYQDWAATAKNYGIVDLDSALLEAGYTETKVQSYFQGKESEAGMAEVAATAADEKDFRDKSRQFFIDELAATNTIISNQRIFWEDWKHEFREDQLPTLFASVIANQNKIYNDWKEHFYKDWLSYHKDFNKYVESWTSYFIKHTFYDDAYSYDEVTKIKAAEKDGASDAIRKLAEALTQNSVDLRDPAIQTNALLSRILIVAEAIMQQNNSTGLGLSLSDTITGLSMGVVNMTD